MLQYVASLPISTIRIVYFDPDERPMIREGVRIITLPSGTFYFNTGPLGIWTYTYKMSDIHYIIYRHDTTIHGFIGKEIASIEGGARFELIGIGNHLTVGLKHKRGELRLCSHRTFYSEDDVIENGYTFTTDHSYKYDIRFQPVFTSQEPLLLNGNVHQGTIGEAYADYPEFLEAMEKVHRIFQGEELPIVQSGGSTKYNGRRYKIRIGSRGGKYIIVNHQKIYLNKSHGGGSENISEQTIDFIYKNIVHRVVKHYENNEFQKVYAKMIYDDVNGDYFVLCYDIPSLDIRQLFYLKKSEIQTDMEPIMQSNIEQKYNHIVSHHIQSLATA